MSVRETPLSNWLRGFAYVRPRCGAAAAATIQTTAPATLAAQPLPAGGLVQAAKILAGHVDPLTDASGLDDEDLLKGLHVTRDQVKQLIEADAETANEVMRLGVVTWRPGSSGDGPLSVGPGDPGHIVIKARPERLHARLLRHLGCQEQPMRWNTSGTSSHAGRM